MKKILRRLLCLLLRRFRSDPMQRLRALGAVIGRNLSMQSGVVIDESHAWHITIGDDVTLAPRVYLLAHDASTKRALGYTRVGKVQIGDRVFIGAASIVLPGVRIGHDVIVAAGSVVNRDVEDGMVVAGNPARVVGSTQAYLEKRRTQIAQGPTFSVAYTLGGGVTPTLKDEMNAAMHEGFGFVE